MSRLDDLKLALAKTGYSPEEIQTAIQEFINIAVTSGLAGGRAVHDALMAFYAMQSFDDAMDVLTTSYQSGYSVSQILIIRQNLLYIHEEVPDMPIMQPTKPTEKTPYYHKSKQKWWK
jgi:hypothetical protein